MRTTPPLVARALGGIAAVAVLSAGCGDTRAEQVLAEGRYHYTATHRAPGQGAPVRLEGVLVITESGADSIAGRWEVPELQPELDLGNWESGAYEVMAHPTYFGVLTHRIGPGTAAGEVSCDGDYTWVAEGGIERTEPVTCSITREDVERPEMPARGAEDPLVRPIDADTVPPRGLSPDARGGPRPDSAR